jgi:hypothetical protein
MTLDKVINFQYTVTGDMSDAPRQLFSSRLFRPAVMHVMRGSSPIRSITTRDFAQADSVTITMLLRSLDNKIGGYHRFSFVSLTVKDPVEPGDSHSRHWVG